MTHGIQPLHENVVVLPDPVEEKTDGGIIKPAEVLDREASREVRGEIVAMARYAFTFDNSVPLDERPEVGARVLFKRHAGAIALGADGREYRILKDIEISAILA